jgi:hypothetical protein
MSFRHSSGIFSYSEAVNGICQRHGLYALLDFIAGQQKRIKKDPRFKEFQRWVHRVRLRRGYLYVYPLDSDEEPLTFDYSLYSSVTEPEITFILDVKEGLLCLASEKPP